MFATPSNAGALAAQCAESINFCSQAGFPTEQARITVVTPKGWKAPPKFPRGELLQVKEDGARVRSLPAMNVLAYLAAHGWVKVAASSCGPKTECPRSTQ